MVIAFAGSPDGMESKLVPREGFELKTVDIHSFKRSITPKAIYRNIKVVIGISSSMRQAREIIEQFRPDVVVGTGGYASYPVVSQAAKMKIPTAIHESNAVPGLTTSLLAKKVDSVMVSLSDSVSFYKRRDAVQVTGTPVREEFIYTKKEEARVRLGIRLPLVVSYWGSLGAREMNKKIADFIKLEAGNGNFHHIHATGSFGYRWMPALVRDLGVNLADYPNIELVEYIYDMPSVMNAADLIICRAGASTISELTTVATPAIMIPSPNVAGNHQHKNAAVLAKRGAAVVMGEKDCTGRILYDKVTELLSSPDVLAGMAENLRDMAILDSTERIYNNVLSLANGR